MAPPLADAAADAKVEGVLLAAALRGDGSKATAGLAFGLLQPLSPYPPKKPAGSVQRLAPALRDGVTDDQVVEVAAVEADGGEKKTTKKRSLTVGKLRTMPPTSKTPGNGLADVLSLAQLRRLVHPRAEKLLANYGAGGGKKLQERRQGGGDEEESEEVSEAAAAAGSTTTKRGKKRQKTA